MFNPRLRRSDPFAAAVAAFGVTVGCAAALLAPVSPALGLVALVPALLLLALAYGVAKGPRS